MTPCTSASRAATGSAAQALAEMAAQSSNAPAQFDFHIPQTVQSRIRKSQGTDTLCNEEMARSKEFDKERALAAAVDIFWRQGYENTSL